MITVALIGPDGAGKTTISSRLESELGIPVRAIYMGVNLHSSTVMLPHMRLLRAIRRRRHGDGQAAVSDIKTYKAPPPNAMSRSIAEVRAGLRLVNWIVEEGYRHCVAAYYRRRGVVVIYDRHFLADYMTDRAAALGRVQRVHAFFRRAVYPQPDLVICLDAPADVLYARKPEGSLERLNEKRAGYVDLCRKQPGWVIVDAGMPTDAVTREVAAIIRSAARDRARRVGFLSQRRHRL